MKNTRSVGTLGEDIATRFLEERGFSILRRNYRRKFAEADIIAKKGAIIHIVEVKSVSRENKGYRPEELVHAKKVSKLRMLAQEYVISHETEDTPVQIDVIAITMDMEKRIARCTLIEHAES